MALQRRRRLYPLALSFAVYLIPLIGPHAMPILGELVWRDLVRAEREPMWIAADVGLALVLQATFFVLLYFVMNKSGVVRLLPLLALPVLAIAVQFAYLIAIPSRFLIENDIAVESGNWPVECVARNVALIEVPGPTGGAATSEFLVQAPDGTYKVMNVPGCDVTPLAVPQAKVQPGGRVEFMTALGYFVPARGIIFSTQQTATGSLTWHHLAGDRLTPIPGLNAAMVPILSTDGEWAAWLEKDSLAIERLDGNEAPLQIPLPDFKTWDHVLRKVDMQNEEVEFQNGDRRVVIALDGRIKRSGVSPLRWDLYREDGPCRVSWTVEQREMTHNALKGRCINSAAMTPSGDLVAVSVTTALNIGRIRDAVYLLRSADGSEVFRRYLPNYTRSPVFFASNDLLVYTSGGDVVVTRIQR